MEVRRGRVFDSGRSNTGKMQPRATYIAALHPERQVLARVGVVVSGAMRHIQTKAMRHPAEESASRLRRLLAKGREESVERLLLLSRAPLVRKVTCEIAAGRDAEEGMPCAAIAVEARDAGWRSNDRCHSRTYDHAAECDAAAAAVGLAGAGLANQEHPSAERLPFQRQGHQLCM